MEIHKSIRVLNLVFLFFFLSSCSGLSDKEPDFNGLILLNIDELKELKNEMQDENNSSINNYQKLIKEAEEELKKGPYSVVYKTGDPPGGDKHDYYTIAPYWWPDPDSEPGLPYIRKDGEVNPETRDNYTDYVQKKQLFSALEILGRAYYLSDNQEYAQKVIALINTWFIAPGTIMNPHLNFAQGIPGRNEGRPFGIIEFSGLGNVLGTLQIIDMKGAFDKDTRIGFEKWLYQYSDWLSSSDFGLFEESRSNNHGTWYDVQLSAIYLYLNKHEKVKQLLSENTLDRIDSQIEPDGKQPHELNRTKSFSYSIMNLEAFTRLAVYGNYVGIDIWNYEGLDGSSIKKAYYYLIPYFTGEKEWEYEQIKNTGDHKDRFQKLLKYAGKSFNEDYFISVADSYIGQSDTE